MTTRPPDPRIVPPWRRPTAVEVVRSAAGWAWSGFIFLLAPTLSLLTLGLFAPQLTTFLARLWGRPTLWFLGLEVEIRGEENLRHPGSRIVVANHQSALDLPLAAAIAPRAPLVLAKAELRWLFPFNLMWVALGQRFVDRGSVDGLVRALAREERSIILAPEGTRSRTGHLGPFKLGAFHLAAQTHAPLVPLVFHGAGLRMPPGRWWCEAGRCVVEVHPPIDTTDWVPEHVHDYAAALEADYRRWLGDPA